MLLTNAEINPLASSSFEPTPESQPEQISPNPAASSYKDRLNRWVIIRVESTESRVVVARFRSHSDAEGHLKILCRQFPSEQFLIVFEKTSP